MPTAPPTTAAPTAAPPGTVNFLFVVPTATTNARKRNITVPSSAQSVAIAVTSVNGSSYTGTPTTANLSSSTSGCQSSSSQLSCSVNVSAPAGTLVFTITAYSAANGGGTVLSTGTVSVSLTAGGSANAPVTMTGTIAKIVLAVGPAEYGNAATIPLTIQAEDANGNTIIGTYNAPVTLSDTDASSQTTLSATSVADSTSAAAVTLKYLGGAMPSAATIGASAGSITGSVAFLPDAYQPGQPNQVAMQYSYDEYYAEDAIPPTTGTPENSNSYTEDYSVATVPSYNGIANAYEINGYYYAWIPNGNTLTWSMLNSNVLEDGQCVSPYYAAWILPLPSSSWNAYAGTGACSYNYNDYSAPTYFEDYTTTLNNDGSYNGSGSYNYTACCTGDLGNYTGTVDSKGNAVALDSQGGGGTSFYLSIPAPSGPTSTVQLAESVTATLPPSPVPSATTMPNPYYAMGQAGITALSAGTLPSPLLSDVFTPKGSVTTLPAACSSISNTILGTNPSIIEVDEAFTVIDPLEYNENWYDSFTTQGYYLSGVGLICETTTYTEVEPDGGLASWYDGSDTHFDAYVYVESEYITASTLTAMMKQRHSMTQALPASAALLQSVVHQRLMQRARSHSALQKQIAAARKQAGISRH